MLFSLLPANNRLVEFKMHSLCEEYNKNRCYLSCVKDLFFASNPICRIHVHLKATSEYWNLCTTHYLSKVTLKLAIISTVSKTDDFLIFRSCRQMHMNSTKY